VAVAVALAAVVAVVAAVAAAAAAAAGAERQDPRVRRPLRTPAAAGISCTLPDAFVLRQFVCSAARRSGRNRVDRSSESSAFSHTSGVQIFPAPQSATRNAPNTTVSMAPDAC